LSGQLDSDVVLNTFRHDPNQIFTEPDTKEISATPNKSRYGRAIKPSPKLELNNCFPGTVPNDVTTLVGSIKRKREATDDEIDNENSKRIALSSRAKNEEGLRSIKETSPTSKIYDILSSTTTKLKTATTTKDACLVHVTNEKKPRLKKRQIGRFFFAVNPYFKILDH